MDGQTLIYDAIGNPLSYYNGDSYTMTWTQGRKLKTVTVDDKTTTYEYDYNGYRTKKIHADGSYIQYYVVGGRTVGALRYDATGAAELYVRYTYDESGSIIGFSLWYEGDTAWTPYYFLKNLQGDVLQVYKESDNTVVAEYSYDSWGNVISATGELAELNPFRYRGYYYDNETGFYYLQSRYYDAGIGRFVNADGAYDTNQGVLGDNMYAYCLNNPVNMHDPDGRCSRFLGFLWEIDCKQASCPDSENYVEPKAILPVGTYKKGEGLVYIVTEDMLNDIMKDKEPNVVVILDNRTATDPNMQIQNSYEITNRQQQKEILQLMLDYNNLNPVEPGWNRTLDSMMVEWQLHNLAYDMRYKRGRTKDCDFNNADEGKGIWDFARR